MPQKTMEKNINDIDKYVEEAFVFTKKTITKFKNDKDLKDDFHYQWVSDTADMAFRAWLSDRIQKHKDEYYQRKQQYITDETGMLIEPEPSGKQRQYIETLGGDPWKPKTKREASEYIEQLKNQQKT